ncbi:Eco57I restriction-modification methylase domain-containing protein, partial [bacterium]|nr:Eco57I restriction-modification methylase domain-containing protein [bacterium]
MAKTITLNKSRILELLSQNKLKELFTQHLGWNNFNQTMPVQVEGTTYTLNGIVEKEGFAIYEYANNSSEPIKYDLRKKISNKLAKTQLEHLIVFTEKHEQVWQWIKRATKNSPAVTRSEIYNPATQSGEKLYQKLEKLFFGWEDYTITDVTQRVNDSLNKDRVTKKFYEEFKKNKDNFSKFIEGMQEKVDKEWYSSLMLNRLMFIYFIQKKGFLNNDKNYMRNKLNEIQEKRGDNKFYSFYREFLLVLFHEGFAMELDKRSAETMQIIGKIPYLNGGLFDVHELERKYTDITIPDSAFETIFTFFDKYDWHLDDRPVSDDKQINPDVIGHIFEKYINQKQMGAYYTKEDITEYISKNTIIPYLFEEAKKKCEVAFKDNSYIWQMLKDNPDKYIYEAVKKGCDKDLPDYISKGIDNVSQREEWNTPTLEEFALPTEIWRETVERRNRYFEVKSKLANGEINSINDFITYNLDIRQFVEDIITNAESSDVVKAFYYTIAGHIGEKSNEKDIPAMSILDPTCGSGAFLFAGLNILEPLYDACIDKMYAFKHEKPDSYKEFDNVLEEIEKHPNRGYFIYKSIILNNLYGVDIMKEATEIAKLRLFLKLASCAEVDYRKDNFGLEALPDIDFNIRAGNSLVGFANYDEVKFAVEHNSLSGQMNLLSGNTMDIIDDNAQKVSLAYKRFKNTQIVSGTHEELISAKKDLQQRLDDLNTELNQYMAKKYGVETDKEEAYNQWLSTHEPFNWFVEFYDVIHNRGGFDVIIGNPPYLEYNPKKFSYIIDSNRFNVYESKNLYSYIYELSKKIVHVNARFGLIIQISSVSTPNMQSLVQEMKKDTRIHWVSNYATRPSYLFDG